jgi:hypothetical protein
MLRLLVGLDYRIGPNLNITALRTLVPSEAKALPNDAVVAPCELKNQIQLCVDKLVGFNFCLTLNRRCRTVGIFKWSYICKPSCEIVVIIFNCLTMASKGNRKGCSSSLLIWPRGSF